MKAKNFKRKLVLKKQTVADLSSGEMFGVAGGVDTNTMPCGTCGLTSCITDCAGCNTIECETGTGG